MRLANEVTQPTIKRAQPPVWTARCKSGYQYHSSKTGKVHTCNKSASRGMLLCPDCLSAEPVPVILVHMAHSPSLLSRLWSFVTRTPLSERITLEPVSVLSAQ